MSELTPLSETLADVWREIVDNAIDEHAAGPWEPEGEVTV